MSPLLVWKDHVYLHHVQAFAVRKLHGHIHFLELDGRHERYIFSLQLVDLPRSVMQISDDKLVNHFEDSGSVQLNHQSDFDGYSRREDLAGKRCICICLTKTDRFYAAHIHTTLDC